MNRTSKRTAVAEAYAQKALLDFRIACGELAAAVNQRLFEGCRHPYWVGGIEGGLCDFEDGDFISADDMARIINYGVDYEEYADWRTLNEDAPEYINLHSWLMGGRRSLLADKPKKAE